MTTALETVPAVEDPRQLALLKAVGLDRLNPEQRELAINIAARYDLDLLLKHVVMIEGRPYITRDGLLHIAHRSRKLDGIETTEPAVIDGFWRASCSVYRKDMGRPFTYTGRYPTSGGNQKYAPEMAVKVAEVMALRRAFDVSAPVAEERWDVDGGAVAETTVEAPKSLADRIAEKAAEVQPVAVEVLTTDGNGTGEDVDLQAEAERIFSDEDDAKTAGGLSMDELKALMREHHILGPVATKQAREMFPAATVPELTDEQRAELWDAIRP